MRCPGMVFPRAFLSHQLSSSDPSCLSLVCLEPLECLQETVRARNQGESQPGLSNQSSKLCPDQDSKLQRDR